MRVKKLIKWGKKYWYLLFTVFFLTATLQLLYSYLPIFIQYGINVLSNEDVSNVNFPKPYLEFLAKQTDTITIIIILGVSMISLQLVRSFMRFTDSYLKGRITENISKDMRLELYDHITDLSYTYHNNVDTGDLIQRCTSDIDTSCGFISNRFPEIVNIIATVLSGAYQVGRINFTLMLISLIIMPITIISSIIYFRYVNRKFQEIEEAESQMMTVIQENLAGARVVRAFANEQYEIEKLEEKNFDYSKKNGRFNTMMAIYWGSSDFLVFAQYSLTMLVGVYFAQKGIIQTADLIACLMLMGMLIWPFRGLGRIIADFGITLVAIDRIEEVLDIKSEFTEDNLTKPKISGEIEFKNVGFKFSDDNKPVLKDINFKIKKGEMIAFVGKTGSGKSTIVNLITRLLENTEGQILIDGVDLKSIDKRHIRRNVGMVLQDPFLFSKTVYENIAIANRHASDEEIYEAARLACIDEDIKGFEKGYDTIVGEKGTTLSGGQKQRIAIARILVNKRPIVIFDDSLSAVDTKTDLSIRTSLKNAQSDMTMIIITHRTTTAKEADRIIVLEDGMISEIGTHEELSHKEGLYKDLWDVQGRLEEKFMELIGGEKHE